jgi:hypothetical protein
MPTFGAVLASRRQQLARKQRLRQRRPASVHHPITHPVLKFVLPTIESDKYHPGGEITQVLTTMYFLFMSKMIN